MVRNGVAIPLRWVVVVALSSARRARAQASDTFVAECAAERLEALVSACDANSEATFDRNECCVRLRELDSRDCFCNVNLGAVDFELRRRALPEVLRAERLCDARLKFGNECAPLPRFPPLNVQPPPQAPSQAPQQPPRAPSTPPPPPAIISPAIISPIQATCSVDGLVTLIQAGCASIVDSTDSVLRQRVTSECCRALVKLNDERCFCSEGDMIQELLREFPANFGGMFKAAPNVCGSTIVGGWQCLPFVDRTPPPSPPPPASPPPSRAIQRAPLPPFIGRTFGLERDVVETITRDVQTRVCGISAYANILDAGCARLPFLDVSTNRAKRCCELIALMNAALCFCESALAPLIASTSAVVEPMFAATTSKCRPGFQTFARGLTEDSCLAVDAPLPASPPPPAAPPAAPPRNPDGSVVFGVWWPFAPRSRQSDSPPLWPERPRVPPVLVG